jgi:ATP-dependent Clp protease adapter protein ClpS
LSTEIHEQTNIRVDTIYKHSVILFNDDINDFEHVENCLMKIYHKNKKEAKKIALLAHKQGKAICYVSSLEECETVGEKLAEQGLTISVH